MSPGAQTIIERAPSGSVEVEKMYAQVRSALFGARVEAVRIDRYAIRDKLGAGGMGCVYAAWDPELGRNVAIKLLRPDRGRSGTEPRDRARRRLLREAKAMAKVSSPHVVTVFEAGICDAHVYVAMEYVDGQTLTAWLGARQRTRTEVCDVFAQAARGLIAVHEAGLVHRDFKPDNVLVARDGRVQVADFGLAHAVDAAIEAASSTVGLSAFDRLTQTGAAAGSAAYMAPEQHLLQTPGPRSDQFSFCVALFEALLGVRPFPGTTLDAVRTQVTLGSIAWPEAPRLPDRLATVLRRGLASDPADRFPDMRALLVALDGVAAGRQRRRLVPVVVGAAVGLAGAAAMSFEQAETATGVCTADARLEAVYSADHRAALEAALSSTGAAFADEVAVRVLARLDAYALEWSQTRAQVCESQELGERDYLTLACLDRGVTEAGAVVEALIADPSRLSEHAVRAVYQLRDPQRCAVEPGGVLRTRALAPTGALAAGGAADVLRRVDEATALLHAGDAVRGLEVAHQAVAAADAVGDDWVRAEALAILGEIESGGGALGDAETHLFEAALAAERADHAEALARARTELVVVIGFRRGEVREGLRWGALAQAAVRRAGEGGPTEVRLLNALGLVHGHGGDVARARDQLRRALVLAQRVLDADHPGLAATLENLASVEDAAGAPTEALALLRRALAQRKRTLGAAHPNTQRTREALDRLQAQQASRTMPSP